jgi:hypothetical protein
MKALISILITLGVILLVWRLINYWDEVRTEKDAKARREAATQVTDPRRLPGLPDKLEAGLEAAYQRGGKGLREWLDTARKNPQVTDPRLAWIELDYVVLGSKEDPIEAKRVFKSVKDRTPEDSPVHRRVKDLERTFE